MAQYLDNPAGRLHSLLTGFRRNASNQPTWQAWAATFGVTSDDIAEVTRCLGLLLALPTEIESELSKINPGEYPQDIVLRWKNKIMPALGPPLFSNQSSSNVAARFDDESLAFLETCSWTLHKHRARRPINKSDLTRIQALLTELMDELRRDSTEIDAELGTFLLRHCREMQRALLDMTISGPQALEDALDKATGAAYRRMDLIIRAPDAPGVWKKFVDVLKEIAVVLGVSAALIQLPGEVRQAIEGPSHPPQVQVKVEPLQQSGPSATSGQHEEISGPEQTRAANNYSPKG